jgi:hypothetical protein
MKREILLALAACGLMGSAGLADTVNVNATFNENPSLIQNVNITDPTFIATGTYGTGVYDFGVNSETGSPTSTPLTLAQVQSLGSPLQGVCIDFTHEISNGNVSDYTVTNLAGILSGINGVGVSGPQALAISHLWDMAAASPLNDNTAAELQLAVWDVLYDPTNSITLFSGNSNIGAARTDATNAEAWAAANSTATPDVFALINTSGAQSFAFLVGSTIAGGDTPVPLPSSATLGFTLLAAFGGFRTLRKHRASKLQMS